MLQCGNKMKHEFCAEYKEVLLRPLHRYDIEYLRLWRNREELSRYLSKTGDITEKMQQEWFERYILNNGCYFFVVDYKRKRTVGTVALYEIHGNECQIGKIVIGEDEAKGHSLGRLSFLMAMTIGIKYLGIEKFKLSVHEANIAAYTVYSKIGFNKYGSHDFEGGGLEFEMKIGREKAIHENPEMMKIKLYKENETEIINISGGVLLHST